MIIYQVTCKALKKNLIYKKSRIIRKSQGPLDACKIAKQQIAKSLRIDFTDVQVTRLRVREVPVA